MSGAEILSLSPLLLFLLFTSSKSCMVLRVLKSYRLDLSKSMLHKSVVCVVYRGDRKNGIESDESAFCSVLWGENTTTIVPRMKSTGEVLRGTVRPRRVVNHSSASPALP